MAYLAVLLLAALLTTIALTFLESVHSRTRGTVSRNRDMTAYYLAEAATQHAKWRILNEPGFPARSDVYTMRKFGEGRYGYRVVAPTATKPGSILAVGALPGGHVARRNQVLRVPSRVAAVYGVATTNFPQHRRLVGASWGGPGSTLDIGTKEPHWMEMKGSPTRNEIVLGELDETGKVRLCIWKPAGWGNSLLLTSKGETAYKAFDVAYESLSGDAVAVGRDTDLALFEGYNTAVWNGASWTVPLAISLGLGNTIRYLTMEPDPTSDEILLPYVTAKKEVFFARWNGASVASVSRIETGARAGSGALVDAAYEGLSGEALVVWSSGDGRCYSRVWDGAVLAAATVLPNFGSAGRTIRMAADPASDSIMVAVGDEDGDINLVVWNGSGWGESREIETEARQNANFTRELFDLAWSPARAGGMIAWQSSTTTRARILRWQGGASLAARSIENGPELQAEPRAIRLAVVPGTDRIVLLGLNSAQDLYYSLWNGTRFVPSTPILLESNVSWAEDLPFAVCQSRL